MFDAVKTLIDRKQFDEAFNLLRSMILGNRKLTEEKAFMNLVMYSQEFRDYVFNGNKDVGD